MKTRQVPPPRPAEADPELRAEEVMSHPVVAIRAEASIREAAQAMTAHGIGGLVVLDRRGKGIGILSASDIVAYETSRHDMVLSEREQQRLEREAARTLGRDFHLEHADDTCVADVMTPGIVAVPCGTSVGRIAWIMGQKRIHRVCVRKDGRIKGIVTALDVARAMGRSSGPSCSLR